MKNKKITTRYKTSKMSRILILVVGLVAATNVIESFIRNVETEHMFGIEMNIWIYRIIWSLIAIWIFYDYSKKKEVNK